MSNIDMAAWDAQNATKGSSGPMPIWQQYGFPDEASYNAVYNQPAGAPAPSPSGSTAPVAPVAPVAAPALVDPWSKTADQATSLGQYLATNPERRSAYEVMSRAFTDKGLGEDVQNILKNSIINGRSSDEVYLSIREAPSYKVRFKANELRQAKGLSPLSEEQIIALEKQYRDVMKSAGAPEGFYDTPDDFTNFIVNDKSPTEIQDDLKVGYTSAINNPLIAKELDRLYASGATPGLLAAWALDPDRAEDLIRKQAASAALSSEAINTGFGPLERNQAEELFGLGITQDQARRGFNEIQQRRDLLNPLAGEVGSISVDEAMSAQFENNAAAQDKLTTRRSERQSKFSGGGGFNNANRQGVTGAGSANS